MTPARRWLVFVAAGALAAIAIAIAIHRMQAGSEPLAASAAPGSSSAPAESAARRKVLFVDSYHEGYPWSEGIIQGALKALGITRRPDGGLDESKSSVTLQIVRMDTKRHTSEDHHREAGARVKAIIDDYKPDVVICADDNASKFVIVPYFRDAALPFVFCGVNWDVSVYGFPFHNVTGMVEVSLIPDLIKAMQPHARGPRIGLLGARNESNMKEADAYRTKFHIEMEEIVFVDDFEAWKGAYVRLQTAVDMLILAPPSFLADGAEAGARQAEARRFVLAQTRIPTGAVEDWIAPYALVTYAKRASEQGEWAARTALAILAGTPPDRIPITMNHQASVHLNMQLAKKLGVRFPVELVEQATLVNEP